MRSISTLFLMVLSLLFGCESHDDAREPTATAEAPSATVYGRLDQANGMVVPLSRIVGDPEAYEGKKVLTEGEVQRVCQKRGCWLELADSSGARAFVPMAGHAFTVPIDSVGERALIEGTVHRRERSDAERQHLQSDGAGSSIPSLSIEAHGVLIR